MYEQDDRDYHEFVRKPRLEECRAEAALGAMAVTCPCCKKQTGYTDDRPDGFIECLHCGYEVDLTVTKPSALVFDPDVSLEDREISDEANEKAKERRNESKQDQEATEQSKEESGAATEAQHSSTGE
jgi:hypothetical protein